MVVIQIESANELRQLLSCAREIGEEVCARFTGDLAAGPFPARTSALYGGWTPGAKRSPGRKPLTPPAPPRGAGKQKKNSVRGWTPEVRYKAACSHMKKSGKTPPTFAEWLAARK